MTKLLLVEDNLMGRKMLVRRLTRKGFEVVVAADGAEALAAPARHSAGNHATAGPTTSDACLPASNPR